MSQTVETEEKRLKFGNAELDRRIGGIPMPSLSLIEGANDSGKTALAQQFAYGVVSNGYKLLYLTTEDSVTSVLKNMYSLNWDVSDYYITGKMKITSINLPNTVWEPQESKYYLTTLSNYLRRKIAGFDYAIVDSLTQLVTHAELTDVLDFFSQCRKIVDKENKSFALTIHPYALTVEHTTRMRSFCDGQFLLEKKIFRDRNVLALTVLKLKGASKAGGEMITFEISPAYGIKILPFTSTRG